MAIATDEQVQVYVDTRIRPHAELQRNLQAALDDDKASIDDVYEACSQPTPTWKDSRTDGPPRLLTPQDVLNFNACISLLEKFFDGTATAQDSADFKGNWAVWRAACVRPPGA